MSALTTSTLDVGVYPQVETRSPGGRICAFVDPGTCELITAPDGSGMLAATGLVQGQRVVVFASDPAVQGGAMSASGCQAVLTAYEKALAEQCPVIGLWHSGGARLGEGVVSLHGVGRVFAVMTRASGRIPQISVVLGAAAGGAAYGPALTDVVILAPQGRIFVTGPDVVRSATGEEVDAVSLGGAEAHGKRSGVAHVVADSEEDAYYQARRVALLLCSQGQVDPSAVEERDLDAALPASTSRAYDVRPLVSALLDEKGVELQPAWARNVVTTLGRIGGRTIGVIATNPLRLGGCLDSLSAEKAARFVRMCDAFGVPLVVVVDVPGYLPGTAQEWGGVVRRGAKLLHAFSEAVVARVTLVTRKAYGGAYIAMNSRALGATTVFAWPSAEVAVMHPVSAVRILHRRTLAAVPDEARSAVEHRLAAEHRETVGGLAAAVASGVVDEVIEPAVTRGRIAGALCESDARRGYHGNIPL
jgi:acetyl-CoA/propionyl-CoA carboxylase carboxyl transferase subunit